jgi:Fic family protein
VTPTETPPAPRALTRWDPAAELAALQACVGLLDRAATGDLDLPLLLALHRRLLPPSHPYRGCFRDRAVVIRLDGVVHGRPPPPEDALRHAQNALDWLNRELAAAARGAELAAEAMFRLTEAHPFLDGNGRVAQTVATWLLLRGGYTLHGDPIRYCHARKPAQYRALAANQRLPSGARPAAEWQCFFAELIQACFKAPVTDA